MEKNKNTKVTAAIIARGVKSRDIFAVSGAYATLSLQEKKRALGIIGAWVLSETEEILKSLEKATKQPVKTSKTTKKVVKPVVQTKPVKNVAKPIVKPAVKPVVKKVANKTANK